MIKDALFRAIDEFNSFNWTGNRENGFNHFNLINSIELYTLKFAKKSEKPNFDLPSICINSLIKNSNLEKVVVLLDEEHLYDGESQNSNSSKGTGGSFINNKNFRGNLNTSVSVSRYSYGNAINNNSNLNSMDKSDRLLDEKKCCKMCLLW